MRVSKKACENMLRVITLQFVGEGLAGPITSLLAVRCQHGQPGPRGFRPHEVM